MSYPRSIFDLVMIGQMSIFGERVVDKGGHPSLGVFRRPPDGIRAPVARRPMLAKSTSKANEIHGNLKNHVKTIRAP